MKALRGRNVGTNSVQPAHSSFMCTLYKGPEDPHHRGIEHHNPEKGLLWRKMIVGGDALMELNRLISKKSWQPGMVEARCWHLIIKVTVEKLPK